MRPCLFVFAAAMLAASPTLAQEASPAPQTPSATATPAQPAPATPAAAAATADPAIPAAQPAPGGQKVSCEYTTHEGTLVPLNHCVSQSEADKQRRVQQQSFREFQNNALMYPTKKP